MREHMLAAAPLEAARRYNIPIRQLRDAIASGACEPPRACGRRSILTFAAVERWLSTLAPTKSSRPRSTPNETTESNHVA
jgi:hypothetical protein